jgi:hypothetical protein
MEENERVIASADVRRRASRCCRHNEGVTLGRFLHVRGVVPETPRVLTEASISGKVDPPSLKLRRASHLRGSSSRMGERNGASGAALA